jgi:fibronectin type 3 domain-containing protein
MRAQVVAKPGSFGGVEQRQVHVPKSLQLHESVPERAQIRGAWDESRVDAAEKHWHSQD